MSFDRFKVDAPMSRLEEVEARIISADGAYHDGAWIGPESLRHLARTLAAEVDELREREIKVSVLVDNEAPFFGAFWSEERDGCFGIIINLKNCAGLAESEEMFAKTVQDTLAHELLHAVQAAYGQMFSETQVREALEDPATLECAEDSEQMIQQMMNDFMEVQDNLIQARADVDARDAVITELLAMLKPGDEPVPPADPSTLADWNLWSAHHSPWLTKANCYRFACEIAGRTE